MTKTTCIACGIEKYNEDFHKDSSRKSERHPYCKSCCSEKRKGYRSPNHNENNVKYYRTTRLDQYRENPIKYLWGVAKKRADKSGVEFTITPDDIILNEYCPVSGVKLDILTNKINNSMSLDRVDNKKGYIPGNVVVISRWANLRKSDLTIKDLNNMVEYIKEYST